MLPVFYLLGGIVSVFHRHGQRLGDIAAGTVVVRVLEHKQPALDQVFGANTIRLVSTGIWRRGYGRGCRRKLPR